MSYQDKRTTWDWEHIQSLSTETECYQLTYQQVNFLLGVFPQYQWSTRWQNLGADSMDDVMNFGANAIDAILTPSEDCGDGGGGSLGTCFRLDTTSEVFDFYPNNPFDEGDQRFTPIQARWRRFSVLIEEEELPSWFQTILDFLEDNGGYNPNDCFVSYSDQGIFRESEYESFLDYLSNYTLFPLPYVNWQMKGTGQFEVELCQTPLGGGVLLYWDISLDLAQIQEIITGQAGDESDNWRLIEVNRDVIGIPPELIPTIVTEIEFDVNEEHGVTAVFYPRLDDQIPFFFPFGGIREIEVCGLTMIGMETGDEITKYNAGYDKHIRTGAIGAMSADDICKGFICAIEEIAGRILFSADKDNILASISVDKDNGTITLQQANIDRDEIDGTAQELRYGGAYYQATRIKQLFVDLNQYIDDGYALATIVYLSAEYVGIDALEDASRYTAWESYITNYQTSDPEIAIVVNDLADFIFCEGTKEGFLAYCKDKFSATETTMLQVLNILNTIPQPTLTNWYNVGSKQPKQGFEGTPCYQYPTETYLMDYNNFEGGFSTWATNGMTNRRVRIELEVLEVFLDADGDKYDGIYAQNVGDDPNDNNRMRAIDNSTGRLAVNYPAYLDGTGKYLLEFECTGEFRGTWFNNTGFTPVSGAVRFTAYDLGALS